MPLETQRGAKDDCAYIDLRPRVPLGIYPDKELDWQVMAGRSAPLTNKST